MKKGKKIALYVMIGINLLLLASLVHLNMRPAEAAKFKTTDYVVTSGNVANSADGVFIMDRATEKLIVVTLNKTTKKLMKLGPTIELGRMFNPNVRGR